MASPQVFGIGRRSCSRTRRVTAAAACLMTVTSHADYIVMKNGDRITGTISRIWDGELTIEPVYGDKYAVDLDSVAYMDSTTAFKVKLRGERDRVEAVVERSSAADAEAAGARPVVSLRDVVELEEITDFDWKLTTDLGVNGTRGNSDTSDWRWQTQGELKMGDHLHLAKAVVEKKVADGTTTLDKDDLSYSYRWTFTDDWFATGVLAWLRDPVRDLQSRSRAGAGAGYYFFNSAQRRFSVGMTADLIVERIGGDEQESYGPRWFLDFEHDLLGGDAEFFHHHQLSSLVSGRRNNVFESSTGFTMDVTDDIYVKMQVDYDTESKPAADAGSSDLTYVLGVGVEID